MKSLLCLLVLISGISFGQVVIPSGAVISAGNNPEIVFLTSSGITNNSSFDFSNTQLQIGLNGTNQTITGNLVATKLRIEGGGVKLVNGNLTLTQEIKFQQGFLKPSESGKILFTGSFESLTDASTESFVDGIFYTNASGFIRFPVGVQGFGFAPVSLENSTGAETGVELVNSDPALTPASSEAEIAEIINTHYWSIITDDLASFNSRIQLDLSADPGFSAELTPVVVEADAVGGEGFNIGGSLNENSISSFNPVSRKIVTLGGSVEIDITIRDLISPFTSDTKNDFLHIDKIEKFPINKVTLLDRWGVLVKEWTNFTNYSGSNPNQDPFDFKTLSPGNYICLVEYGSETQKTRKKSQMVTVLKIK
jgi:hypothetical protein